MCDCNVGPGKFEAESAGAALAYYAMMNGYADDTHGRVDFFSAPLWTDADADVITEASAFARSLGYCDACITEALASTAAGASLTESEQGFVYYHEYATEAEYQMAKVDAADADDTDDEDGGA